MQQMIGIGAAPNDGTGDPLRTAFSKANDNFSELYTAVADGTVTVDDDPTLASNSATMPPSVHAVIGYVAARLAALINSAPGALDTLKELADAIGDDGNFAATVTTALANKLGLGGGTLTGALHVPDDAYAAGWNGSDQVPTKNAVYDKIEAIIAGIPGSYTDEQARDAIGAALVAGTGISITVNDAADTITVAASGSGYTDEQAQDAAAAMIAAGTNTGLSVSYNDAGNAESIAIDTAAEAERVRDTIAAALVAGSGIAIVVDDAGDTITLNNVGSGGSAAWGGWTDLTLGASGSYFGGTYRHFTTTFTGAVGNTIELEVEMTKTSAQGAEIGIGGSAGGGVRLAYQNDGNKLFYQWDGSSSIARGATGSSQSVNGLVTMKIRLYIGAASTNIGHGLINDQRMSSATDETISLNANLVGTLTCYVDNVTTVLRARARLV